QIVDVNRDGVGLEFVVETVELLLKHSLGYDTTKPSHEVLQDRGLASGKRNVGRVNAHVPSYGVEMDVAGIQGHAQGPAWPTQKRLGAGNELRHCERLDEIIIGACVEPGNP